MKGIILCGGKGVRLYPLTQITNKSLLPVYNKPAIAHGIDTLVRSGIKEIILITGGTDAGDFLRHLRDGRHLGLDRLEYNYHEPQKGVLDALYLARHFAANNPTFVLLADNLTDANFQKDIATFPGGAKIFLKKVPDPQRYGVPVFDKDNQIVKIEEKPKNPPSNYAITGMYLYDATLFKRIEKILAKNPDANISYLNRSYLKNNCLNWREIKDFWVDIGTIPDLFLANYHFAKKAGWRAHPNTSTKSSLSHPAQLLK